MACPRCGSSAPAVQGQCAVCGFRLDQKAAVALGTLTPPPDATGAGAETSAHPPERDGTAEAATTSLDHAVLRDVRADATTASGAGLKNDHTTASGTGRPRSDAASPLSVGQDFGARYHIIRLLGAGGMGAVYQAWDKTLEVAVAVKVIRPQENMNPEDAERIERRFKRELLLARQVTHTNVVRIHDLGEIDGITYITMPYVQGSDLATILRREGALPAPRALAIATQIGRGLEAAHKAGVIHRDLKPANIMVEGEGNALIMDFGIARSASAGMTMTVGDAVVGTIDYMAPEQVRGGTIDQRVDIYAFGLILNDMLLGHRQGGQATSMAALLDRMLRPPVSVRSINPTIPPALDALITTCLQPDPAARYQTMTEVVRALEQLQQSGDPAAASPTVAVASVRAITSQVVEKRSIAMWAAIAAVLLVVLGATGWLLRDRSTRPASTTTTSPSAVGPPISLAVLPFRNASGDPTIDSLGPNVSQVLTTMLGQSSRVRTVASDRLNQVLRDLHFTSNEMLAPTELARVADFTSARQVLWGQYSRFGNAIRIDATLQDLDRSQTIALNAMAPNEGALLPAIAELAGQVQNSLARGSRDVLSELQSTAWKPSTSSFEALRLYNEGVRLTQQGSHQEALKNFEAATKQDGNFALAFSALGRAYSTLGYDSEAEQFSRQAMGLSESLPPQEKYLIAANHYRIVNDTKKAIEAYENLVKVSPTGAGLQFDLGGLYEQSGDFDKAREHLSRVVELDPKYVEGLLALGRVEVRQGKFEDALGPLNAALTLAIQLNNDEARANVLQAIGIAYKRLGRPDEALKNYQSSLEIKQRLGDKRGMAASLGEIAQLQAQDKPRDAEQSYNAALKLQREIGDKSGTSVSLINLATLLNETLGRPDEALPLLREALQIRREAGNPRGEALVLSNIGSVYLMKGDYSEAQTYFERTLEIRDKAKAPSGELADTLHNLGETLIRMGRYDQALADYVRALDLRRSASDKRGAAIESYSVGAIFDYQGRYGAAIKSKEEALQTFRDLKQRNMWLGEILSGYGNSLALGGRTDESKAILDEAMAVARELQNTTLMAQTIRFQAGGLYYAGDAAGARGLAEQATQTAAKASDRSQSLLAQAEAAIIAVSAQPTKPVAATLARLALDAETLGLKSLAVECSTARAEALLKLGDRTAARQEADRTLAKAEQLGLRLPQARARFVRAEILRGEGDAAFRREYGLVLRLLNDLRSEDGNQNVLKRADLSPIYADSERLSK